MAVKIDDEMIDYVGILAKLSLSPDVGGNLPDILGYEKTAEET